ncbi:MAG TPA: acyl carrier protein [bacterium]|nr:acyl carrier protein [bacterium]
MSTRQQKVLDLVSRTFKTDAAAFGLDEDMFERLGLDSLRALDFLSVLEVEFGITIPDNRLKDIKTFRNLVDVVSLS